MTAIDGVWYNPYNSKMTLAYNPMSGGIVGRYSSTTGSSGTYLVLGAMQPNAVTPTGAGVPISLVLFWRALSGSYDPSWNYVSGMAGQLIIDDEGNPSIQVMHQLVATMDFDVAPMHIQTGWNSDKVIYGRTAPKNAAEISTADAPPEMPELATSAPVRWICKEDPSIVIIQDETGGAVFAGTVSLGAPCKMLGVTNIFAQSQNDPLQGFSLATVATDPALQVPMAVSMAGWIDSASTELKVIEMRSVSTTWEYRWTSVRSRFLTFAPG